MQTKECYKCGAALNESNKSWEHVIPNALGGVWKSKDLLCKQCNADFGNTIDAVLCKYLLPLAALLNIDRQRGEHPMIKNLQNEAGEIYHLEEGRIPVIAKPTVEFDHEKNTFRIVARDEKEAKKIIKQLKNKYPNLDDTDVESKFRSPKEYLSKPLTINLSVGGEDFMRSIIKIAISAWLVEFADKESITPALKVLLDSSLKSNEILKHYYTETLLLPESSSEVAHRIYISGNPSTHLLFCYIELFSGYAFVINLNKNYNGKEVEFSYAYDVLAKEESRPKLDLAYTGILPNDPSLNKQYIGLIEKKLTRVLRIADKRQIDQQIKSISRAAVKKVFAKYPGATKFTEEMLHDLSREIAFTAAPFIAHVNNKSGKRNKEGYD